MKNLIISLILLFCFAAVPQAWGAKPFVIKTAEKIAAEARLQSKTSVTKEDCVAILSLSPMSKDALKYNNFEPIIMAHVANMLNPPIPKVENVLLRAITDKYPEATVTKVDDNTYTIKLTPIIEVVK